MRNIIFTLLTIFFFSACEYDSDNIHYKDIEKPKDIQIGVDLAGVNPDDTIYIYANTQLHYSLDTQGKEILNQYFFLDGKNIYLSNGYLNINPYFTDGENHKLDINIELKSNTGSMAEAFGYEKYIGKISYNLKFITGLPLQLNIKQEQDPEGYLKLTWNKPELKGVEVEKYEISYKNGDGEEIKLSTINNPNTTYIVDKSYVYGYRTYTIKTVFENGRMQTWTDLHTADYSTITGDDFTFEDTPDIDKIKISWDNKFPSRFVLKWIDNKIIPIEDGKSSIIVQRPYFSTEATHFQLYILPDNQNKDNYEGAHYISVDYAFPRFKNYSYDIAYNAKQKQLLGVSFNMMYIYNAKNMEFIGEQSLIKYNNGNTGDKVRCSPTNGMIAYSSYQKIYLVKNNDFKSPTLIESEDNYLHDFLLTDDRLIIKYLNYKEGGYVVHIYNANNGQFLYKFAEQSEYFSMTISSNGKYFCYYTTTKFKIYELGETQQKLILEQDNSVNKNYFCRFDPINSNELILSNGKIFYKLNVQTLTKSKEATGYLEAIDPVTGNMLYSIKSEPIARLSVLNSQMTSTIFEMAYNANSSFADLRFINGFIIKESAYIDVSKYLKK